MQIEGVIHKIQELREGHNRVAMQEVLADLKQLRQVLSQEAQEAESGQQSGSVTSSADTDRLKYRLAHLTESFAQLMEQSEKEKAALQKEVDKLNYRVEILKGSVKTE